MSKSALVLEGGGMRGAYTAGVLTWMIDNGIEFDNHYGISTGAIHLSSYLLKRKDYLRSFPLEILPSKNSIGVRPFLKEGRIVGHKYMFDHVLKDEVKYDIDGLINCGKNAKVGLYDLEEGKTIYLDVKDLDKDLQILKASTSLPAISKTIKVNGHSYLDGGITDMIPVEEAKRDGNETFVIVATKPLDYVRKPANAFLKFMMRVSFPRHKSIAEHYKIRHLNYVNQINIIKDLIKEDKALYLTPSKSLKVSRLKGDPEVLNELFELGYSDAENNKDKIIKLSKKK